MSRLSSTFTKCLLTLPLAAGLLGSATNSQAQTNTTATIPFAFSANHQYVPAGSYKVQLLSDRFLCLQNIKTAKNQCLMVRPESQHIIETQGRLVFYRSGSNSYLTQVWIPGTNIHSELVNQPKQQTRLATKSSSASSSIEVALK